MGALELKGQEKAAASHWPRLADSSSSQPATSLFVVAVELGRGNPADLSGRYMPVTLLDVLLDSLI